MSDQGAGEQYDEKARRIKDLLSSYYGAEPTAGAPAASGDSPDAQAAPAPSSLSMSIDSPGFDARAYYHRLLQTDPLDSLLEKHIKMASEIRSLDSDMQMLVYENYNKFISATDTIRNMKVNVAQMIPDMEELRQVMDRVADKSTAVNSKMQERRDGVEHLSRVRLLLTKLQAVFEVPQQLAECLERGDLSRAVVRHAQVAPILRKYGHRGTFRLVASAVEASMQAVRGQLRGKLSGSSQEAAEAVALLAQLGEDTTVMRAAFLDSRMAHLGAVLAQAAAVAGEMAAGAHLPGCESSEEGRAALSAWGRQEGEPPALDAFVAHFNELFFTQVAETVQLWSRTFPASDSVRAHLVEGLRRVLQEYCALMKRVTATCGTVAAATAAGLSPGSPPDSPLGADWGAAGITAGLIRVAEDMAPLEALLPELHIMNRCEELIEHAVRHHACDCFLALQNRVLRGVREVHVALTDAPGEGSAAPGGLLAAGFRTTCELLEGGVHGVLAGLLQYEAEPRVLGSWTDVFVDLVQSQLQALFVSLLGAALNLCGACRPDELPGAAQHLCRPCPSDPYSVGVVGGARGEVRVPFPSPQYSERPGELGPPPKGCVLLLARLCSHMERSVVASAVEAVAATFPGRGGAHAEIPAFAAGDVVRRLSSAASALLAAYVEAHGRGASILIRRTSAATNWVQHREPRGPRAVCDLLLDRLSAAEGEVGQLLEEGGARGQGASQPQRRTGDAEGGSGDWRGHRMERDVARLFQDKIKVFGGVQFTHLSVLSSIAAVALKSLSECIRLVTLNRAGLQQLQLDVHYLRPRLRRFSGEAQSGVLEALLDDVLTGAVDRALEPTLLESGTMDMILANHVAPEGGAPP